jgi:hypothetical protein
MFNFVLGFLVGVATGTAGLVCFALAYSKNHPDK